MPSHHVNPTAASNRRTSSWITYKRGWIPQCQDRVAELHLSMASSNASRVRSRPFRSETWLLVMSRYWYLEFSENMELNLTRCSALPGISWFITPLNFRHNTQKPYKLVLEQLGYGAPPCKNSLTIADLRHGEPGWRGMNLDKLWTVTLDTLLMTKCSTQRHTHTRTYII